MITFVVEAAVRSLLLGSVVWAALFLLRPRNPHLQKTVWIGVLLASLAMPFAVHWNLGPPIQAPQYVLSLQGPGAPIANALTSTVSGWVTGWSGVVAALYSLVVFTLTVRFGAGLAHMWRIRSGALPLHDDWVRKNEDIRVSTRLPGPATFASTILLPVEFSQWTPSKLAVVLSHERSHVRRRDCYVQWLARLHACVFWINPLAWWMQRRLAMLAETTSDDAVVAEIGDRTAYAEVLLEIATMQHAAGAAARVAMSAAHPNVSARIERIISNVPPASPPGLRIQILSVALLLPVMAMSAASVETSRPLPLAWTGAPAPAVSRNNAAQAKRDSLEPRLVSSGDRKSQEKFYPASAKRRGIEGLVEISMTLDTAGHVLDTAVLEEEPRDAGFGDAAAELVRTFVYSNPSGGRAKLSLRVKFELKEHTLTPLPAQPVMAPQVRPRRPGA